MDNSNKKLHYLPLQRSFEVTRGQQPSFANNFWSKRDRDVGLVSVRSSWPGESNDMQYDPFRSSRDLGLTWPEVKLWPWPFKVILYMVRRALTRQTRWYQIRCSIFKIKDFIVETPFWKIFGILTPGDPNFDLSEKMTEMISKWFFASFRTLPFVFLYGDQEPRSWGGRSNAPPPAGGGKSRGPAGRGLINKSWGRRKPKPTRKLSYFYLFRQHERKVSYTPYNYNVSQNSVKHYSILNIDEYWYSMSGHCTEGRRVRKVVHFYILNLIFFPIKFMTINNDIFSLWVQVDDK